MLTVLLALLLGLQSPTAIPPRDSESRKSGRGALSGRITEQGTDRPLPRAIVTLVSADRSRRLETLADDRGRYEFTGLQPGEYALWAEPGEHRSAHLRQMFGQSASVDFAAGPPAPVIELTSGEQRTGADIALSRALAIEGRVSDSWDDPMTDVEVHLTKADGTPAGVDQRYSDDRGEYCSDTLDVTSRTCRRTSARDRHLPASTFCSPTRPPHR
jgi:hypothetical protein